VCLLILFFSFCVQGHGKPISAVAFSRDGRQIGTFSLDELLVKLWQPATGLLGILGGPSTKCIASYSVAKDKFAPSEGTSLI
jgi:WD40 repeat protein